MPLDEDSLRTAHPNRALVHLANGDALVWDVRDVKLLRTQHNIIGLMSGTLPLAPQQNVFLGLPLQLIPEEVSYLLRVGAIVLIDQTALEKEEMMPRTVSPEEGEDEDPLATSSSSSGVLIPRPQTSSPHIHTTPQTASSSSTFTFPHTQNDRARCAVFDDLHARGYFLGTGLRFGGEFVVYPGDPLRYHSHFSTTVMAEGEDMSALDFVASGRLGTAVKKAHLICAVDTDDVLEKGLESVEEEKDAAGKFEDGGRLEGRTTWGRVRYYSLTWSGFGT
ncbi:hypothetical protein CF327_g7011 [Tilletia walkeri]|uniref:tRNA-splicing endonuclease subunit Sen34 n=1 Tax=Tilletia walkeri TaxID=117179 RepID=A0A8X7N5P6_9BASI|nr:hypothetical protein CF327_g7011 [Tilletia walkeri]KAE8266225.1 hypothetical protein A4X09_0g6125 [Tilletia walkeri]